MTIKATTGGLEANLHQAYKHCPIGAMPSQTYGIVLCPRIFLRGASTLL